MQVRRMRKAGAPVTAFILWLVLAVFCGSAAAGSGIGVEVRSFTLENGMLFLVVERHTTPQVACRLAIRAGSALEQTGKTGVAHMLEHMMFKGTGNYGTMDFERDRDLQQKIEAAYQVILAERRKRTPDEELVRKNLDEMARLRREVQKIYVPQAFSAQLGRNGAVGVNAFTSKDQTQYFMSVPSDMMEQWFSIVSEQLFEPVFREFYVEKEVVEREWAYRYVNSPGGAGWLALDSTLHTAHPYRNPVIGWKSDMERFSTKDAEAFHKAYYNPANAVAVLVGDVTVKQARRMAEVYFERYPAGRRSPERVTQDPPQGGPKRVVRLLKGARTPSVLIGHHGAAMGTDDFYALDVMTMVLSRGNGARMTQNLVRKGRAAGAWAYNPDNRYGGQVVLGGTPNEPEEMEASDLDAEETTEAYLAACRSLEALLLEEVARLEREPVTQEELDRVKTLARYDFLTRLRSNEDLAGTLATLEVQAGWEYLEGYLERLDRVTTADVMRVARTYVREEDRTTCFVIPGGRQEQPPEPYEEVRSLSASAVGPATRSGDLSNHSAYPTPEGWQHPLSFHREPERIAYPEAENTLVNQAPLFYLPDRELPLIDLSLIVRAGKVDVPEEKAGLTRLLMSTLVAGGTRVHGPYELASLLDAHAIQLRVTLGEEVMKIKLSMMREEWDRALDILEEVLTQPRFDDEVLEAARSRILTALSRQAGDAGTVSRRELETWHFQGHPYGRDPLMALETIPTLTKEDLRGFLNRFVVPSNMVVAVSGDLSREEAEAGVGRILASLEAHRAPERNLPDPSTTPAVLAFINKPGQVQSQVTFALPGPRRTDPDYWKTNLLMDVFGGQDSLLFRRLRDDMGFVYSAYAYSSYKWKAGWLVGYLGCKADRTGEAIQQTAALMEDLRREIPEDELETKRLDALNSFVFNVDTPAALTSAYAAYRMRGEPLDTLDRIQTDFMEATARDLVRLAREYLDPRKLQVVVVGDGDTPIPLKDGTRISLEESLRRTALALGLPFRALPLR